MKSVYLIKEEENNYFKIGISKNPLIRIKQLQTGSAGHIILYYEYASEYASKIEKAFHRRYKTYNVNGEWFNLREEHICEFIENCSKYERNFQALDITNTPYYNEFSRRSSF